MKTIRLTTIFAVFLLFCVSGVQAQTTETKLNQVELYKQFIGTWKCALCHGYDFYLGNQIVWRGI